MAEVGDLEHLSVGQLLDRSACSSMGNLFRAAASFELRLRNLLGRGSDGRLGNLDDSALCAQRRGCVSWLLVHGCTPSEGKEAFLKDEPVAAK